MGQLNRITQQPDIMGGKACLRGIRVTVGMVVGQIGAGRSADDTLIDYPYLEREDVSPDVIGPQVLIALRQMAAELEAGALLTVDPYHSWSRVLPLQSQWLSCDRDVTAVGSK